MFVLPDFFLVFIKKIDTINPERYDAMLLVFVCFD